MNSLMDKLASGNAGAEGLKQARRIFETCAKRFPGVETPRKAAWIGRHGDDHIYARLLAFEQIRLSPETGPSAGWGQNE
jgi:hypothetical protein